MNQQAMNGPGASFEAWREEIGTFVRQTIHVLQELIGAVDEVEESSLTTPNEETRRMPSTRTVVVAPTTPRDLDASQDRLANLKRELAAKLSNASRDENRS